MPRIINAYDGNSALGETLAKLGESIYGDQSKNEVYRQKAFSQKNINDLVTNPNIGLDDVGLAKAQLGIGGTAAGTFPGQGRALANDRFTNAATNAAGERNNVRNNAETHYSTDRTYQGHIDTTRMNNDTSIKTTGMNNDTTRGVQLAIDARTMVPVDDGNGGYVYSQKSDAAGRGAPMSVDQVKAGVISQALRNRANSMQPQPSASPFTTGAPAWNASAPPAAPQQSAAAPPGTVDAGAYGRVTPQIAALLGQTEQQLVDPATGRTGSSFNNGGTLADGTPAASFVPTTNEGRIAQERDNKVRTQAGTPLPPAPTAYPDTAKDAGLTSGVKSAGQQVLNHTMGLIGVEPFPAVNRARENLQNQAQSTRELIASAPGRAAVMDKKWADELIPQPGVLGVTGMNATEQMNRSVSLTNHLRQMYEMVQQDAVSPNTPPAERVKMEAYLRNLGNVIQMREKVTPEAGAPAAAPQAQAAAPTAGAPPQAAQPPVPGAAQAPDGHWYVKQGAQYFRVDQ